jgi:hypothetical protein
MGNSYFIGNYILRDEINILDITKTNVVASPMPIPLLAEVVTPVRDTSLKLILK